jgi:hypothetical protein
MLLAYSFFGVAIEHVFMKRLFCISEVAHFAIGLVPIYYYSSLLMSLIEFPHKTVLGCLY